MDPVDLSKRFAVNRPATKVLPGFAMYNQGQVEAASKVADFIDEQARGLANLCAGARSSDLCPHCQVRRIARKVREGDWMRNRETK